MDRRGFMGSILALATAPAIVRADSLMRVIPVETKILSLDDIIRRRMAEIKADLERAILENNAHYEWADGMAPTWGRQLIFIQEWVRS